MSKRKAPEPTGGKAAGKRKVDQEDGDLLQTMEGFMGAEETGDLTDVVDNAEELAEAVAGSVEGDDDEDDLLQALDQQEDCGVADQDEGECEAPAEFSTEIGELPLGLEVSQLEGEQVDLSEYELTLPEARKVAQCLARNDGLTTVKFSSGCELPMGDLKEEGELEWDSEEYTDVEAIVIAELLKTNSTVSRLDLARNQIADAGAVALATMLSENTTIEYLNLESNTFGEAGGSAMVTALENNTSVQYLNLMYNNCPTGTQEAIRSAWQASSRGIGLHL